MRALRVTECSVGFWWRRYTLAIHLKPNRYNIFFTLKLLYLLRAQYVLYTALEPHFDSLSSLCDSKPALGSCPFSYVSYSHLSCSNAWVACKTLFADIKEYSYVAIVPIVAQTMFMITRWLATRSKQATQAYHTNLWSVFRKTSVESTNHLPCNESHNYQSRVYYPKWWPWGQKSAPRRWVLRLDGNWAIVKDGDFSMIVILLAGYRMILTSKTIFSALSHWLAQRKIREMERILETAGIEAHAYTWE